MRSKRIDELEAYIWAQKTVDADHLCQHFHISKSTLRRDLDELSARGRIKKIYGGVTALPPRKQMIPYGERTIASAEAKRAIGLRASGLVNDGDVIFIDSGTTTPYLMEQLATRKKLTILTNNIDVILRALPHEELDVITLSGVLNRKLLSFTGPSAVEVLKNYNISKAFLATTGFSIESGVTNSSSTETEIKRMAVQRSREKILLADHTKIGGVSLFTYCTLSQIDILVTDEEPSPDYAQALAQRSVRTLVAGHSA